jgi:hypothetical protein
LSGVDWPISTTPYLQRASPAGAKEGVVLGVGLDWVEDHPDVALGLPDEGAIEQLKS